MSNDELLFTAVKLIARLEAMQFDDVTDELFFKMLPYIAKTAEQK